MKRTADTAALYSPLRKRGRRQRKGRSFQPAVQTTVTSSAVREGTVESPGESMQECLDRVDAMIKKVLPNYDDDDVSNPREQRGTCTKQLQHLQ